jgi:hypothetical protein
MRLAFLALVSVNTGLVGLTLFLARGWFSKVETHMAYVEHSLEALAVLNVRVERIEKDMIRIFDKVFA